MKPKDFKLGKHSLTYLKIRFKDGKWCPPFYSIDLDRTTQGNLNQERGIHKLEQRVLKKYLSSFDFAILYNKSNNEILHYYHHSKGIQQLDKAEYAKLVAGDSKTLFNLYLVPGRSLRTSGNIKGQSIFGVAKEDVAQYWNVDLAKILLYRGKKLVYEFVNGVFKKNIYG